MGIPIIYVGGGVLAAFVATQHVGGTPGVPAPPPPTPQNLKGGSPGSPIPTRLTGMALTRTLMGAHFGPGPAQNSTSRGVGKYVADAGNQPTSSAAATAAKQAEDAVKAALKKKFDSMTSDAKKQAADAINKQYPGANVQASDDLETIMRKTGAAVGGVEAAAACSAVGAEGAAPLCAVAGAYLGDKVAEIYHSIGSHVEDAANDAYNYVVGLF